MLIFLIGFMGSGKSTIGKLLANKLNYTFIDSDAEIERQKNMNISDIFDSIGELEFRKLEHEWLVTLNVNNAVVALGGGLPCSDENISLIKQKGVTVFIDANEKMLADRLKANITKRPLLKSLRNENDLMEFIILSLRQRRAYYAQAGLTIRSASSRKKDVENILELMKFQKII